MAPNRDRDPDEHLGFAPEWRKNVMDVSTLTPAELARRRAASRQIKQVAQAVRDGTLAGHNYTHVMAGPYCTFQ